MINNRQSSNQKLFVLCIGAQKSGTSWLHQLLSRSRDTDMGFLKEYKSIRRVGLSLREEWARRARNRKKLEHLGFQYSMPSFKQFLRLNNREKQVLMSIVKRGFRVKIVYLMRDPVERVFSQIRMIRRDGTRQEICACRSEGEAIFKFYKSPKVACHTRYEYPLDAIQRVFPREDILIEFYEKLFSYGSCQRIESFLGIRLPAPYFFEKVNATFKSEFVSMALKSRVAHEYVQTYSHVRKNFGEDIFELWPNSTLIHHLV